MKSLTLILCWLISLHASAGIVILNGLSHTHENANGVTVNGRITVQNNGKKEARIMIYQEDLVSSCQNPLNYQKVNSHDRSLSNWIKTNVEEKVLQSNEIYEISYNINLPKGLKGSYWSVIMVEGTDPIKEEMDKGIKIDSKVRYAVLIVAHAETLENPKIDFENISLASKDSVSQSLNIKLKNNGLYVVPAKVSIEIYDASGKKIKTTESLTKRVYPDKCTEFELVISDLPKGRYESILIADNGKDLFGSSVLLEIP